MWTAANRHDNDWLNFARNVELSPDLNDNFQNIWDKLVHRKHPYDAIARGRNEDVGAVHRLLLRGRRPPQVEMKAKLDLLLKHAEVLEH